MIYGRAVPVIRRTAVVTSVRRHYREFLESAGPHMTGTFPDGRLTEFIELDRSSSLLPLPRRPGPPRVQVPAHLRPSFVGLIKAGLERQRQVHAPRRAHGDGGVLSQEKS